MGIFGINEVLFKETNFKTLLYAIVYSYIIERLI